MTGSELAVFEREEASACGRLLPIWLVVCKTTAFESMNWSESRESRRRTARCRRYRHGIDYFQHIRLSR